MRDFNNSGDINGDVVINDNSVEYKPLYLCTNEELIDEEDHRKTVLKKERKRQTKVFLIFIGIAIGLCVLAFIWYQFTGGHSTASTILGAIGAICGFVSFTQLDTQTEFEKRQLDALHEIHMLLRDRDVR